MKTTLGVELVFYKDHKILNCNIEIYFHKERTYLLNEETSYPITKFTLTNCRNPEDLKFENIDPYNDGIIIEIFKENEVISFCVSDVNESKFTILCDKAIKEDLEYRNSDLIDIIKSVKHESQVNHDYLTKLNKKIEGLTTILEHDLEKLDRKIKEANWLTAEKLKCLEGQRLVVQKTLDYIKNKGDKIPNI